VIVEHNGRRESGLRGGGGRYGYDELPVATQAFAFADEALRQALVNLEAIDAPAGTMPVVLGAGWPGVLLHEAVGHGLEGDFNRKGTSTYAGRMGSKSRRRAVHDRRRRHAAGATRFAQHRRRRHADAMHHA
jgi:TldD protein